MTNTIAPAGLSIIEKLWNKLDEQTDALMQSGVPARLVNDEMTGGKDPGTEITKSEDVWCVYGEQRGRCQALAFALSLMCTPVFGTIDEVRAEAMRRWQEKHGGNS